MACSQNDTPSEQGDPGDLVRMARCKYRIEDFPQRESYCSSLSDARETLRQMGAVSFTDYPCRGDRGEPRTYLRETDGTGSVTCVFDTATGQLVGVRLTSDAQDFCEKSSRSVLYGEDPSDCALYPGQSCPPFDVTAPVPQFCVLTEACAAEAPACDAGSP
ncbi:MAG TPA: hypothetical protein VJU61_02645 [Polyangiaceae bacterium]|nr:hypothetical protein [Polyangiaceae bacterium]